LPDDQHCIRSALFGEVCATCYAVNESEQGLIIAFIQAAERVAVAVHDELQEGEILCLLGTPRACFSRLGHVIYRHMLLDTIAYPTALAHQHL
jgi:hypothetical protein